MAALSTAGGVADMDQEANDEERVSAPALEKTHTKPLESMPLEAHFTTSKENSPMEKSTEGFSVLQKYSVPDIDSTQQALSTTTQEVSESKEGKSILQKYDKESTPEAAQADRIISTSGAQRGDRAGVKRSSSILEKYQAKQLSRSNSARKSNKSILEKLEQNCCFQLASVVRMLFAQ